MNAPDSMALRVDGLAIEVNAGGRWWPAVQDVNFDVRAGEVLAVVGESGCGKSITVMSLMGLLPRATFRVAGRIRVEDRDVVDRPERELRSLRGRRIGMIFQEPMTALNPLMRVGDQIAEAIRLHEALAEREVKRRALELMEQVRIPSAAQRYGDYPHQFSGGMRQRIAIAMAIACGPAVLVADEPTTALDASIQAQILDLLHALRLRLGMSVVLISHNLALVASVADGIAVMYAGHVVEIGAASAVFEDPVHPYTQALVEAAPRIDRDVDALHPIAGRVPSLADMPRGCRFADRCPLRVTRCDEEVPPLVALDAKRSVRCWVRAGTGDAL